MAQTMEPNQSQNRTGQPVEGIHESPPAPDEFPRQLLEQLRKTSAAGMMGAMFSAVEGGALLEVERRHRGAPFSVAPVAVELVAAALKEPFKGLVPSPQAWQELTRQIAQAMCEDPSARERLARLWDSLCEQAP